MAMLYGDRFCFSHIPKTGGKWVRASLEKAGFAISDLNGSHEPAPEDHPGEVSFTFVRHPAFWLASWWAHMERTGIGVRHSLNVGNPNERKFDAMQQETSRLWHEDFETFVRRVEREHPGFVTAYFTPYMASVDHVGQQESLRSDLAHFTGLEIPDSEPRNVGINRPTPSPDLVAFVAQREDMELLGYA